MTQRRVTRRLAAAGMLAVVAFTLAIASTQGEHASAGRALPEELPPPVATLTTTEQELLASDATDGTSSAV